MISKQVRKDRPSDGYSLRLSMSMVHKPTLERLARVVGYGLIHKHRSGEPGRNRDSWQWAIYNSKALEVIERLLPYLVTKAAEARIAQGYANRPRTYFPKGGRTCEGSAALEQLRGDLKAAKRYEWKHGETLAA